MDPMAVRKTCLSCGADVTHKSRHKTRHGEYLCSTCAVAKKRSFRHRLAKRLERLDIKPGRIILYAVLAVAGCWIFYKLLDILSQPGEPL